MRVQRNRNLYVQGSGKIRQFRDKKRESRLRRSGHVQRRDARYITSWILKGATKQEEG